MQHFLYERLTLRYMALATRLCFGLRGKHENGDLRIPAIASTQSIMPCLCTSRHLPPFLRRAMLGVIQIFSLWAPLPPRHPPVPWNELAWATMGFFTVEVFVWPCSLLTENEVSWPPFSREARINRQSSRRRHDRLERGSLHAVPWRRIIWMSRSPTYCLPAARWFREKPRMRPHLTRPINGHRQRLDPLPHVLRLLPWPRSHDNPLPADLAASRQYSA